MNEELARKSLAQNSIQAFDDINNHKILGASNHIKMIGEMIEDIIIDAKNKKQSAKEVKTRIKNVSDFFKATRGEASQAITNAINLMTKNLENYDDNADLNIIGKEIIETKNLYQDINKNAINLIINYSLEVIKGKKNIFVFDYSSTVEKVIEKIDSSCEVYIAESRVIDGGKPFLKTCQNNNLKITYLPDAAIMHFLRKCDIALMGAETFYPDGTGFNTTGSDIVGLLCREYDIPLYFLTPMIKIDPRPVFGKEKNLVYVDLKEKLSKNLSNDIKINEINFITPELLAVEPKHIKAFITEKGIIPSNSMFDISLKYLKEIGGEK